MAHNYTKFWTKLGSCNLIVEDPNPRNLLKIVSMVGVFWGFAEVAEFKSV